MNIAYDISEILIWRKSRGNTSTEADSLFSQSLDEDGTVSNRTVRNTERYSQIVSGWNKVLDALDFSERVRNGRSLDPQFQDDILTFKFVMKILHVILEFEAFGIESLVISEAKDLKSYSNTAGVVVSNLKELRIMKPEIAKLHSIVSCSSRPLAAGEAAEVVSFISLILENLNNIFSFNNCLIVFLKEQLEAIQKQLLFLRNFLGFLSEICILPNSLVDLLSCAEAWAVEAACLLYFILVDKMNGEDMSQNFKTKLVDVVEKIKSFSHTDVKKMYVKSLEASRTMITDHFVTGEPIDTLFEKLSSVRCYIEETPSSKYKDGLENFRTVLLDLIIDLGCFIFTYLGLELKEKIGHLLDKIQFIESASGDLLIPRSWQTNFPKTNESGFIDFILMNLREKLNFNVVSVDLRSSLVQTMYEELVAMRHDFGEIARVQKENEELKAIVTHYKDVAYQAEYLVDLSLYGVKFSARHRKVKAITMKKTSDNLVHNIEDCPGGVSLEANLAGTFAAESPKHEARSLPDINTSQLVGLERDIEDIKGQLMRGSKQLKVLSIVGMPGIGKTTLANSVYRDPTVILHFHVLAWCSVSQVYHKENLLNEILHQIRSETSQDCENGLDQQVYQRLNGRRYLVIFDDVWDTECSSCPSTSLGRGELETLANNAIQGGNLPSGTSEYWEENCKGLPLSIVLVAGLLKTTERNQDCWEIVGYQLRSYVADNRPGQPLGILELIYACLPDYLNPASFTLQHLRRMQKFQQLSWCTYG
ncbi:hypothetical protein M9H77_09126 [Catharanthus roseus]|uniref:Uncharacterized protein n=1 Tax=Catharanthus roseus TaxID=4058 RepID=A0ACC0C049_CATRO|nr:hypothetical protein M9H77_09126 [Catharanthus roseus]